MSVSTGNSAGVTETADKAIAEMAAKLGGQVEELTQEQFKCVFRQALASGDFMRLVKPDGSQAMEYLPFRRSESLERKIEALETQLADYKPK